MIEIIINLIDSSTYGSKMPRADWEYMGNLLISYSNNLQEQKEIVAYIEEKTAKIDTAISKAEQEIKLTKEYMESLIYNAVTGQIRVD